MHWQLIVIALYTLLTTVHATVCEVSGNEETLMGCDSLRINPNVTLLVTCSSDYSLQQSGSNLVITAVCPSSESSESTVISTGDTTVIVWSPSNSYVLASVSCSGVATINQTTTTVIVQSNSPTVLEDGTKCTVQSVTPSTVSCLVASYNCEEGHYYSNETRGCISCESSCLHCNSYGCHQCEDGMVLIDGKCVNASTLNCELASSGVCRICKSGDMQRHCESCRDAHCSLCIGEACVLCDTDTILINGTCMPNEEWHVSASSQNSVISCLDGYYNTGSSCEPCNVDGCSICETAQQCSRCNSSTVMDDGKCTDEHMIIKDGEVVGCGEGYTRYGNHCYQQLPNCNVQGPEQCIECMPGFVLRDGTCQGVVNDTGCTALNPISGECAQCGDGMFLKYGVCTSCPTGCTSCVNATKCTSCEIGYVMSGAACVRVDSVIENCLCGNPKTNECYRCADRFYRENTTCVACASGCASCQSSTLCYSCVDGYYLDLSTSTCQSTHTLLHCVKATTRGCTECKSGMYVRGQHCANCSDITSHCSSCDGRLCTGCDDGFILAEGRCIEYQRIRHCSGASNSKCSSCSALYSVTSSGDECELAVKSYIFVMLIVCIGIGVIGLVLALVVDVFIRPSSVAIFDSPDKAEAIYKMETSKTPMDYFLSPDIVSNKQELCFDAEGPIPVDEETKEVVCIGNIGKSTQHVYLTVKSGCEKYELRTVPRMAKIKKGMACEFEVYIRPLCCGEIEDNVIVVCQSKDGGDQLCDLYITGMTMLSSKVHYSNVTVGDKIGEGKFGCVYKGYLGKQEVVIKQLKDEISNNKAAQKLFREEVDIMDRYRCPYLIQTFGSVIIPGHLAVILENAPYGSISDIMNGRTVPQLELRVRYMVDAAKGVRYLHQNGVLHKDIKPDNILIFTAEYPMDEATVTAKLTDSGSSLCMVSVGSNEELMKTSTMSSYLAPEVTDNKKYSRASDIYAYGMTLYEVLSWEVLPKDYQTVQSYKDGSRPPLGRVPVPYQRTVTQCWDAVPRSRCSINQVIRNLEHPQ